MSRGKKPALENYSLNWSELFNKNVGSYLQQIIVGLGRIKQSGPESAVDLLSKIRNYNAKSKHIKAYTLIKKDEKPFKIPNNWVWCRLGEIIEVTDNLNIESKLSKDTLINYVDIDAIDNRNYKIKESKLKPVAELSSRARRVLKKGYVLYSLVRPYLNNVAIVEDEKTHYIGSTGFSVFNGIFIENEFLKYFLLTDYIRDLFLSFLSGFNSPSISYEQFASALVPLPPVSEQKQILSFLECLKQNSFSNSEYFINEEVGKQVLNVHLSQLKNLQLTSELTHQLYLLKKLRQQLLQDAVQGKLVDQNQDDEPASILLQKIKAKKKQLIKEKKLKAGNSTELSVSLIDNVKIPQSWQWSKTDEIFFVTKLAGFEYTKHFQLEKHGEIPVIRAQNVRPLDIEKKNLLYISKETSLLLDRCALTKMSLLITFIGAGIGDVATFDEKERWHLAPNVAKMEPFNGCETFINVKFINYFLMSNIGQKELFKHIKATAQPSLSMSTIRDIDIPFPPIEEQHRIVQKLDQFMEMCDALEANIIHSKVRNDQLLQQVLKEALTQDIKREDRLIEPAYTEFKGDDKYKALLLAAEIIWQLNQKQTLGHIKLQKLIYLCNRTQEMNLPVNFLKWAMGPYDPELQKYIDNTLVENEWFKYDEDSLLKYEPLKRAGCHKADFDKYFARDKTAINHLIQLFENAKSARIEIVATLFACWDELIAKKQLVNDNSLLAEFYNWSEKKKKHTTEKVIDALRWMETQGIVPN